MLDSAELIRKWLPSISRDLDLRCKVCMCVCVSTFIDHSRSGMVYNFGPVSVCTVCMYVHCEVTLWSHHSFKFKHIQSHTAQYKHSFFVRTVPEWNSLPELACVNADTVTAFQTQLRHKPWAVRTPHRRDTRKWSDDYWTRTRTRTCVS